MVFWDYGGIIMLRALFIIGDFIFFNLAWMDIKDSNVSVFVKIIVFCSLTLLWIAIIHICNVTEEKHIFYIEGKKIAHMRDLSKQDNLSAKAHINNAIDHYANYLFKKARTKELYPTFEEFIESFQHSNPQGLDKTDIKRRIRFIQYLPDEYRTQFIDWCINRNDEVSPPQ